MRLKAFLSVLIFSSLVFFGNAQECTLDIGGKNTETLIKIFQLNEMQVTKMETWKAELELETKTIEGEIQKLFDNQPQSTPEQLTTLADKYRVLQQKIVNASWATDKLLLSTFNEKQYMRYLELCKEAVRRPIKVVPVILKDTIADPE